jgi:aromatic-L-amino-acid decarboxylase
MTTDPTRFDMTGYEFRHWGHEAANWVADYFERLETYPVLSAVRPGETRQKLPGQPPEEGESMEAIFADLQEVILPGITHWNHPSFFAYFPSSSAGPGVIAEFLAAALNVNAMVWKTSPSATELEETVLDWLRQMLGLGSQFQGVTYDTASVSTFHALTAARNAIPEWDVAENGLSGPDAPRLSLYTSEHAHSSIEKAGLALGIGRRGIRKIRVDDEFRMDPQALGEAIQRDRAAGWRPFCVSATVGTTSTTSVDPVAAIADVCEREELWLHVDAAYAGVAALLPERPDVLAGCERADSLVTNPHKWLFTPVHFSAFFCRRREAVKEAFSLVPEYLKDR